MNTLGGEVTGTVTPAGIVYVKRNSNDGAPNPFASVLLNRDVRGPALLVADGKGQHLYRCLRQEVMHRMQYLRSSFWPPALFSLLYFAPG